MASDSTTGTQTEDDKQRPGGSALLAGGSVARIGYGAMQLDRLRDDRDAAVAVVRRAIDAGVDHIDTAQFYGDGFVNGVLRDAIHPEDRVLIASKVGAEPSPGRAGLRPAQRPEQLRAGVEQNLRSLGLDRIPLVNLRRLDAGPGLRASGDQVVDIDAQLEVMTAMRDEGMIGAIGISSVGMEGLRHAIPAGIVCVQNAYSLVARGDEDMLELCVVEGIAWVPYFPLGSAFPGLPKVTEEEVVIAAADRLGRTPSQIGLAWLLQHAPNVLLIPGTADISHLEANLVVGEIELDQEAVVALDAIPTREPRMPLR